MLEDVEERYIGAYVGTVVYTKDPNHLGRVQVRVPEIYGSSEYVADIDLPWAGLASVFGGFYDGGSHFPYPVGSTVLVIFEQGDKNRPWVLAGVPKQPVEEWVYGDNDTSMEKWLPKDTETDVPKEVRADREETKYVLFKTPKGAALVVEEKDSEESLRVFDRAGQVVEMLSPVKTADNEANASQRGIKNSVVGDQLPYSKIQGQEASIRVIDLAGQYIRLKAKENEEEIEVYGCKRQGVDPQRITVKNKVNDEEIRIVDRQGQTVYLRTGGGVKIVRMESGSNYVEIDGNTGTITMSSTGSINITSTGPVNISGSSVNTN